MDFSDYLRRFTDGYAEALLWADTMVWVDPSGENDYPAEHYWWQTPAQDWALDAFGFEDRATIVDTCEDFVSAQWLLLLAYGRAPELAGHDFLLSRNGHGTGFWDHGTGRLGDLLHAASKPYGSTSAYCYEPDTSDDNDAHLLEA